MVEDDRKTEQNMMTGMYTNSIGISGEYTYVVYYTTNVVYYTTNVNSPEIPILVKGQIPEILFFTFESYPRMVPPVKDFFDRRLN